MNNNENKQLKWHHLIQTTALILVVVLIFPIVSPSLVQLVSVIAEENPALSRIYGMLADTIDEPETSDDYYELANIAIGQNELDKALEHLEKARELADPENKVLISEMWLKSASVYALKNDYESALPCLNSAIEINPAASQALLLRAQILIDGGKIEGACRDLEAYIALNPADTTTWITLAQLYESIGKFAEAKAEYEALYSAQPESQSHLLNALRCGFLNGEYETSVGAFDEYLTANPEADAQYRSIAAFLKAASLMQLARYEEAVAAYEAAIAEGYDQATCYEQMVISSFEMNDFEGTIKYGEKMTELGLECASPDVFNQRMGAAMMQLTRYEEAVQYLDKSIALNESLVGNYYYRGVSNLALSNHEAAIADFTKSIEQNFLTQFCYYNRGVCYVQMVNYEAAIEDLGMTLTAGEDESLIKAAKDILWQLAAYYENQTAAEDQTEVSNDDE